MGDFENIDFKTIKQNICKECDWECFRDPSEMLGNALELLNSPLSFIKRYINNKEYFTILREDLKYYKSCDYFDGKKDINLNRLLKFK